MTALLRIRLRDTSAYHDGIVFAADEGSIVGLAGLEGHGQREFLRMICGLQPSDEYVAELREGDEWHAIESYGAAAARRVIYVPGDRKTEGILPTLSILDNFAILSYPRRGRARLIDWRRAEAALHQYVKWLHIRLAKASDLPTSLSGGNQQKLLLARALAAQPRVLLLDDPTRGVDHPTKLEFQRLITELARGEGLLVLLLSTELEELLATCDHCLIFRNGRLSAALDRSSLSLDLMVAGMFGQLEQVRDVTGRSSA